MASIRDLKRDINSLFFELLSDALIFSSLREEKGVEAQNLIEEAVASRNEFIERVKNPYGKDKSVRKRAYYTSLRRELTETVNEYFRKLSLLAEK